MTFDLDLDVDCDNTYHHEYQCQMDIEYIVHQISLENPENYILIIHIGCIVLNYLNL